MAGLPRNQPLPLNPFDQNNEGCLHSAYNCCLKMEYEHLHCNDIYVIHARCLGYLITELPPKGRKAVSEEILVCSNKEEELRKLSEYYINTLIRIFKANKGTTPPLSSSDGFFSEIRQGSFVGVAEPAPRDHRTAKYSALKRDAFRCVVTGCVDYECYEKATPEQRQSYDLNAPDLVLSKTNYCHIFSPLNWNSVDDDLTNKKQNQSSSVWAIIQSFGSDDLVDNLNGPMIHDLTNGFTMNIDLQDYFDHLQIWFEYIPDHPQPNTYRVCSAIPRLAALQHLPPDYTFTFKSTNPSLPVPRPEYLQLHAAICRVARLSGAGHYLDLKEREVDIVPYLTHDGSSACLLASRLEYLSLTA